MKVFQIFNNICYKDYTLEYDSAKTASLHYSKETKFVDAPDYVFAGWGFNPTKNGDERFEKPIPPEGWEYDENNGTFINKMTVIEDKINELKDKLFSSDYKIIKCSECSLLGEELPYNIEELNKERQEIRDEINKLEKELGELNA